VFQQLPSSGSTSSPAAADDDSGATLLTAHWASTAEHGEWIASPPNQALFPRIQAALDPAVAVEFFHVEGVEAFTTTSSSSSENGGGGGGVLGAPVVSVVRYHVVPAGGKEAFEAAWMGDGAALARLNARAAPYAHLGGWRIEKPARKEGEGEEDREEYVVVGGWESAEKAEQFFFSDAAEDEEKKAFEEAIAKVTVGKDVRLYKRFL
jgi:heme-degrading monooxygenase HmoA